MLLNLVKLFSRIYFKTFHNFKVEGLENIPKTGSVIIASNHLSNADPPAIGGFAGLVRDSRFVAKKELFEIRGIDIAPNIDAYAITQTQRRFLFRR